MAEPSMLCNAFCNPEMIGDLEKTRTLQIAPDVWMLEGYAGFNFFVEPPSGNIFILRDNDLVLLMDTGHHGFYREKILNVLRGLAEDGARELVLTLSHGHWDHGKNNDIIDEAGFETTRFILAEPELHTINIPEHMIGDAQKVRDYFDPFLSLPLGLPAFMEWARNFPEFNEPRFQKTWKLIESIPEAYDADKTRAAWESLLRNVLCPDLGSYLIDRAEPLLLSQRETRRIGGVELTGWPVGRFFLIHDGSQSPGHVCLYDPLHKLMITGDATLEINPPFFDCNFNACIDISRQCLQMAEQGDILLATDCHRTSQWWIRSFNAWGMEPLAPIELLDVAQGRDQCMEFYRLWVDYFTTLREEVLLAHARIGEATVPEIVAELRTSNNRRVVFKLGLTLPNIPSSPEMLVARVLAENGAARRVKDGRNLFTPSERWKFTAK